MYKLLIAAGLCWCVHAKSYAQTDCSQPIFPQVMTPNGDGFNDTWIIGCLTEFSDNELVIYNRWGEQVYKAFDYNNDWQATWEKDKSPLPDGTYVFIFKAFTAEGEKKYSGSLTIIR